MAGDDGVTSPQPEGRSSRRAGRKHQPAFRLPPHFPVRHAVGIDISDGQVELLELRRGPQQTLVVHARSEATLPAGVVRDGEILDEQRLVAVLASVLTQGRPRPFSRSGAILSLPESKVYLRTFEFPKMLSDAQVRQATPFEAEGVLPLTLDEVYHDVVFHRSREQRAHHVLFAAAPKVIVDAYVRVLQAAGIRPVAFDVESAALARSIVGYKPEPVLVADIGGRASVISVVEREEVHSAVTIPVAGNLFTERITQRLRIAPTDAEERKRRLGLTATGRSEVRSILEAAMAPLVEELRRTAQYHETHTGRPIRELLLAGGSARMPGLVEYLHSTTGLAVRIGDPWRTKDIRVPPALPSADRERLGAEGGAFATVVGLGLRGLARDPAAAGINLLPEHLRLPLQHWRSTLSMSTLAAATATLVLVLAALVSITALRVRFTATALARDAEQVRTQLFGERFAASVRDVERINAEVTLLRRFQEGEPDVAGVLATVRSALPGGIQLQAVEVRIPPENTAPYTVRLTGLANQRQTFLSFERALRALPGLQEINSPISNLNLPQNAPFVVTLTLRRR